MKKLFLALLMGSLFSVGASAAATKDSAGDVEPDKGDGCGLGWQVTQKRTFLATTTRSTTNAFVPPTFGMTTGTIGCEKHDFAKNEQDAVNFAVTNYEPIMIEMASGQGEYLNSFARALGCDDSAASEFGRVTHANYRSIVGQGGSVEMYKNVKGQIQGNPVLASGCRG